MFTLIDDSKPGYDPYNSADTRRCGCGYNDICSTCIAPLRNERDANRALAQKVSGPESMFHVKQAE